MRDSINRFFNSIWHGGTSERAAVRSVVRRATLARARRRRMCTCSHIFPPSSKAGLKSPPSKWMVVTVAQCGLEGRYAPLPCRPRGILSSRERSGAGGDARDEKMAIYTSQKDLSQARNPVLDSYVVGRKSVRIAPTSFRAA